MNNTKVIIAILSALLLVSIVFNAYYASQTLPQGSQKSDSETRLEMTQLLSQAQVSIDAQLKQIGDSLIYASQQLSTIGISGDQARAVVHALALNNSFIINAATQDLNNNMIIVEPNQYQSSEGKNVGEQEYLYTNPYGEIKPMMNPYIPLVEGSQGIAIAAPVYNSNKERIGSVSVIFHPNKIINATLAPLLNGKEYSALVIQTDGYSLYDTDPAQQGKTFSLTHSTQVTLNF